MNDDRARQFISAMKDLIAAFERELDAAPPSVAGPGVPQTFIPSRSHAVEDAAPFFVDYGKFYDFLRGNKLLGPVITKPEFEGCDAIIRACLRAGWGVSYTAYALGTSYLETAATMQPIKEKGGDAYFTRMYDINGSRPAKAKELGNLTPGDGKKYPGHGYVQLTGKKNYAKLTEKLRALGFDVDLVKNPELAMRPDIAAMVMVIGMEEGLFTSRKLSDDLPRFGPGTLPQFVKSRDIINGTDRQNDVADYAFQFQTGLMQAGYKIIA